jgi:hypothetical protein
LEMVCKPKDQRVLDFLISKSKMRLFSWKTGINF